METASLTRNEALRLSNAGTNIWEVRAGIRHIGLYSDYDVAEQLAEFYDAHLFDWATGDYA